MKTNKCKPTIQEALCTANADREYFLRHLLKISKDELFLRSHECISTRISRKLTSLERKRNLGWPMQYLTGEAWFYGLRFKITPAVLIPRQETEMLVDHALKILTKDSALIDIGTGSGCVAIACAKNSRAKIIASDISKRALRVAVQNARMHNALIRFKQSNLLKSIAWPKNKFVVVTANLPYLNRRQIAESAKEVRYEPKIALYGGRDGLRLYRDLFYEILKRHNPHQTIAIIIEIEPWHKNKITNIVHTIFRTDNINFFRDIHGDIRDAEIIISK